MRAVVCDVQIKAKYGDERSSLKISNVLGSFLWGHIRNTFKRIFMHIICATSSGFDRIAAWYRAINLRRCVWDDLLDHSATAGIATPAGTVMLAALPVILGLQLLLAALNYDIASTPTQVLHKELRDEREDA